MYGTVAQADDYFVEVGFNNWTTFNEVQKKTALTNGASIVDALYGYRFLGAKTGSINQMNQWPRKNIVIDGTLISDDLIPEAVKRVQYEIVRLECVTPGYVLKSKINKNAVKKEKVDILEREFFGSMNYRDTDRLPYFPQFEALLSELLINSTADFPIYWVR